MTFFIAILFGILAYVILNFLLALVKPLAAIAEILAIIGGILVTLFYAGGLH